MTDSEREKLRQNGLAGLKDWLRRYAASQMDTGYRGFVDAPVLQVEGWVAAVEELQEAAKRALLRSPPEGECLEPDWLCPECGPVPPEHVTFEETHDMRVGGCGSPVYVPRAPSAAPPPSGEWRPTHRHKSRGSSYQVIANGWLQCSADSKWDDREVVIYRGEDGTWWGRPAEEFNDGRFEPLSLQPSPAHPEGGES